MCQRGGYSLLFVLVDEDQDAVHRGLESAQGPNLTSLDSVLTCLPGSWKEVSRSSRSSRRQAAALHLPGVWRHSGPWFGWGVSVEIPASCPCRGRILCARRRWIGMPWYAVCSAAISPGPPSPQIIRQAARSLRKRSAALSPGGSRRRRDAGRGLPAPGVAPAPVLRLNTTLIRAVVRAASLDRRIQGHPADGRNRAAEQKISPILRVDSPGTKLARRSISGARRA